MSQQLEQWMRKLAREVVEGVAVARRVKLIAEGVPQDTWEPIIGEGGVEPAEWARDAENLIQNLIPELPKKRVQLQFVAEDASGAVLAMHSRTVQGQNANAQDLQTQNGAKALSDAFTSLAKTMEAVNDQGRKLLEFQAAHIEKLHAQINENHEVMLAIHKLELEEGENENAVAKVMTEQLKEGLPLLIALGQHLIANLGKKGATGGLASVATAATAAMNGAA